MSSGVDVVLEDEVVGLNCVPLVVVLVDVEEVAAFEVGVEDKRAIVFALLGGHLAFYLGEVVLLYFGLEVDPCDVHQQISKVVFFHLRLEPRVIYLPLAVHIPESTTVVLLLLAEHVLHPFLHAAILVNCVLDGDESVSHQFGRLVDFGHDEFVGPGELFLVQASRGINFIGFVLAIQDLAGRGDVLQNTDLHLAGLGEL